VRLVAQPQCRAVVDRALDGADERVTDAVRGNGHVTQFQPRPDAPEDAPP